MRQECPRPDQHDSTKHDGNAQPKPHESQGTPAFPLLQRTATCHPGWGCGPAATGGKDMAVTGERLPYEVFVFVRREREYLVLHRSERQGAYWHGVAGGLEVGETYAEAAGRALRE